jgi:hypothetical protein
MRQLPLRLIIRLAARVSCVSSSGTCVVVELKSADCAILELAAMQPISFLPQLYVSVAARLVQLGLLNEAEGHWFVTDAGLAEVNRTPRPKAAASLQHAACP